MSRSILALVLAAPAAAAAVPLELHHQGRVFDAVGQPIDGAHDLSLSLYDAPSGGTAVWQETQSLVFDVGYFSVPLGADAGNPLDLDLFAGDEMWLGLSVDTGPELSPRVQLRSVPFAFRAGHAATADVATDALAADHATSADSATSATTADSATTATNLSGGTVDATEVRIDGTVVIDSSGALQVTPAAHNHAAADVVSGLFDVARLPVGGGSTQVAAGDHTHDASEITGVWEGGVRLTGNSASCDSSIEGTLRYTNGKLEICDGADWSAVVAGAPGSAANPGVDCRQLLANDASLPSGEYVIDPTGSNAVTVWCDMSTLSGGWTVIYAGDNSAPWGPTYGSDVFGDITLNPGTVPRPDLSTGPGGIHPPNYGLSFTELAVVYDNVPAASTACLQDTLYTVSATALTGDKTLTGTTTGQSLTWDDTSTGANTWCTNEVAEGDAIGVDGSFCAPYNYQNVWATRSGSNNNNICGGSGGNTTSPFTVVFMVR